MAKGLEQPSDTVSCSNKTLQMDFTCLSEGRAPPRGSLSPVVPQQVRSQWRALCGGGRGMDRAASHMAFTQGEDQLGSLLSWAKAWEHPHWEKRDTESNTQTEEGFTRQKAADRKRRTETEEGLRAMTEV
ncbi:hypothetical protein PAMP_004633 [Pampus punctatissimus]